MDLEQKLREALTPCGSGPEVRASLRARLAGAARPAHSARRTPSLLFLLGTVFVVAAAAAAWQLSNRQSLEAMTSANDAAVATDLSSVPEAATAAASAIVLPMADEQPVSTDAPEAKADSSVFVDSHTVVVVMRPELAAGMQESALANRCFEAVTAELRGLGGLNIVTDSSVFRMTSPSEEISLPERDRKIARSHGAGNVLKVTTQMGCNFALFNSQTGARVFGQGGGGVDPLGGREYEFSKANARSLHAHILGATNTEASEAKISLLNADLSDRDRTRALFRLVRGSGNVQLSREAARNIFDKEVLAAAIQLATKSPDAQVRDSVWGMLRDVDDPAMVQLLLRAIADDADRSVRYQAIQNVRKFLNVPGVREALQRAGTTDPDSQPEVFCCVVTVREAAERASVPDSEFLAWVRSKLLDENLPARSRLINLVGFSSDGRLVGALARVGKDAATVVFEIGQRDQDPRVRAMAWDVLYSGRADRDFVSKEVVPVLLKDLQTSTDERVRAGAASILFGYTDNSVVQEAMQRAQSDESIMVRRAATGAGVAPVSAY
jgi:HEAT repeat protein